MLGAGGAGRILPDRLTLGDGILEFDSAAQAACKLEDSGTLDPFEQKFVVRLPSRAAATLEPPPYAGCMAALAGIYAAPTGRHVVLGVVCYSRVIESELRGQASALGLDISIHSFPGWYF